MTPPLLSTPDAPAEEPFDRRAVLRICASAGDTSLLSLRFW